MPKRIANIAINTPVYSLFDYQIPSNMDVRLGNRVNVKFRNRDIVGVVFDIKEESLVSDGKLKEISSLVDNTPTFSTEYLSLISWVSSYYHHPIGQTLQAALPKYISDGKTIYQEDNVPEYHIKQNKIFDYSSDQENAIDKISDNLEKFNCFVLDGITGSGKTEVYKNICEKVLRKNRQVAILSPEINLIPQLVDDFIKISEVSQYHSGLTEKEKFMNWCSIYKGYKKIIIGTRSSIFTPFNNLGLIIIDEEHDVSFKQQEGLKYNARDVATYIAKSMNIPIILGSATPSLESINNIRKKNFIHIRMKNRVSKSTLPDLKIINMDNKKNKTISEEILLEIKNRLDKNEQSLLFLNRRGYSPVIICKNCSWIPRSKDNKLPMTYHKSKNLLICHHSAKCIPFKNICPSCGNKEFINIGEGTEKVEEIISNNFSNARIIRIDSDTTRKKGELEKIFKKARNNDYDILIGTQMLSKGHNFPNVTLVAILNIDQRLFSPNIKAIEQLAQQLIQVSGRAGRYNKKGTVFLQTSLPDNDNLKKLIKDGYENWAKDLLAYRKSLELPPHKNFSLFKAKSRDRMYANKFLENIKETLIKSKNIEIFGPIPSTFPKKNSLYNMHLVVQSNSKKDLNYALRDCINRIKNITYLSKVRWSIDIDPIDYD